MFAGAPKKSDNTKYYDILGVSKYALPGDLMTAYRKAAMENHPDKGGDLEKFKELAQAYEVMSNPLKRYRYLRYGEDPFEEGMGGDSDPFHIFQSSFCWSTVRKTGVSTSGPGKRMRDDAVLPVMVSLEDLYNGTSQKLPFPRKVICSKCCGKRPGETIDDENRCQQCMGENFVLENKVVELHVGKGMRTGQLITFRTETITPTVKGEINFIILQKEHPTFKRKGDDLFVEHTLSLTESLCGFQFGLTHLDNRQLIIKSQPGEFVKHGQIKEINDEGMPLYLRPYKRGKLCIHFTVEFPDSLTPEQSKAIGAVLPPTPSPHIPEQNKFIEAVLPPTPSPQIRRCKQAVPRGGNARRKKCGR